MNGFDFDSFIRDFHAYRRRQGHTLTDVSVFIGRPYNTVNRSVTPPFERIWFITIVLLADYADLSLDDYRKFVRTDATTTRLRSPRLERSRTAGGYPILRSTRAG